MRSPRSLISLHSLDTVLLEMPLTPMAGVNASTRRGDTPPLQASWMTATGAVSEVLRGSGKLGHSCPRAASVLSGSACPNGYRERARDTRFPRSCAGIPVRGVQHRSGCRHWLPRSAEEPPRQRREGNRRRLAWPEASERSMLVSVIGVSEVSWLMSLNSS